MMSGCAAKFACKENPNGPGCQSVSGMYDSINKKKIHRDSEAPEGYPEIIQPGTPIRDQSKVLRVWIAPWVDKDDDYHDQAYVYLVLNHGHWFIDRENKKLESKYAARVIPPSSLQPKKPANQNGQASNSQPTRNLPINASNVLK